LASIGDRLIAVLLDMVLVGAVFAVTGMLAAVRWGGLTESGFSLEGTPALVAMAATAVVGFLYYWLCEGLFGATLGKGIIGIAVRRQDGSPCTLSASLVRNLLRIVDGVGVYLVGFLVAIFSKSRQRLGDHVAKTLVLERKSGTAARGALVGLWLVLIGVGVGGAYMLHRGAGGGALRVINVEFLQSKGGPARPSAPYKPGETVYLKYDVAGFTTGSDDKIDLLLRAVARDPAGTNLHEPWEKELVQTIADRSPVNGSFSVELPLFVPPGAYTIDLQVQDKVKNATVRLAPAFQVEAAPIPPPSGLEVRDFAMSLASEGPPVQQPVVEGGATVYSKWKIFGAQFRGDRVDLRVGFKVLGPDGKLLLDRPDYVTVADSFVYHPPAFFLPITGHLSLPSGADKGVYTAQYEIVDNHAQARIEQAAKFEVR
jgi:uncharacterized RDD family membrane protein YckC